MDPLDPVPPGAEGTICAVCEGSVPPGSVQLLARRDDLAFVQVSCDACHSTTLAFVLGDGGPPIVREEPLSADDVLDMHRLLSDWHGGLRDLLRGPKDESAEAGRAP